ncbi:hypothetical protein JNUCC64_19975 [Streptomyces sp. JNUCC 64]
MIRDALLHDGPPAETGAHCHVCGRWTTAPVVIGYTSRTSTDGDTGYVTHHACPHDISDGQRTADHTASH